MNENIEILLIIGIIVAQIYFFWITYQKINLLKAVFGSQDLNKVSKLNLFKSDLESVSPMHILSKLPKFQIKNTDTVRDVDDVVRLGILAPQNANPVNEAIYNSINTYLLRNSGAAPDFNLIKDIAERNSDAVEEEIGSTISIPLYLGLLGTLLGVIFGLTSISGQSFEGTGTATSAMLDLAIPTLLSGVKVAMWGSFTGLLLTIANSGFFYKKAKSINVHNKNDFFTFIQIELLPILNQNLNATLYSLQANLLSFNKDFGNNVVRLDSIMNKNYDALVAQERIMEMLSDIDIAEFATANVKILKQLQTSIATFGDFSAYAQSINFAIQKTENVVSRIDKLMQRTEGFETVTQHVLSTFETNHELMEFLKSHFSSLDYSKQMIADSVVEVNEQISLALDQLRTFTAEKIATIQRLEVEHVDLMKETYPERWKSLDELKKIEQIIVQLTENGNLSSSHMTELNSTLVDVKEAIGQMDENILTEMKSSSISNTVKGWFKKEKVADEEV